MTALIPINISFPEWTAQLRNTNPSQQIPELSSEKDWHSWVNMLMLNNCFPSAFIPQPIGFRDWRSWASQFLLSIGA